MVSLYLAVIEALTSLARLLDLPHYFPPPAALLSGLNPHPKIPNPNPQNPEPSLFTPKTQTLNPEP